MSDRPLCAGSDFREEERRLGVAGEGLCFIGLAPDVWEDQIGGYPVLRRWLRARAGRVLEPKEVRAFRRMAAALAHAFEIQRRIDEVWYGFEITAQQAA